MKTSKIHTLIVLTIFLMSMVACRKTQNEAHTTAIGVVGDITDTGLIHISSAEVITLFGISDSRLYNGYTFRCRHISEAQDSKITQLQVKPEGWLLSDENKRIAELKGFKAKVTEAVESLKSVQTSTRKNSLVVQTLSLELDALAKTIAQDKVFVVTSDLYQHDENFSFYSPSDFKQALDNPNDVVERFEKIAPLPNLKGIKVYLVFRPRDYEAQQHYDVAADIFSKLLRKHGAEVIVTPNIVSYE